MLIIKCTLAVVLGAIVDYAIRRWRDSKNPLSLPTNIENATREYVRKNLAAWDAKIGARRAKRLKDGGR